MRRVDDGGERVDTHHTEVGDGERSSLVLFRLEFAIASLSSEFLGLRRDGSESLATGIGDDRSDETGRGGDGNADILGGVSGKGEKKRSVPLRGESRTKLNRNVLPDEVSVPSRVGFGNVLKGKSGRLDDEVVNGKLDTSLDTLLLGTSGISRLGSGVEGSTELVDSVHVDFDGEVVVRNGRFGFGEAGSDNFSHVGSRGVDVLSSGTGGRGSGSLSGRRSGGGRGG